MYQKFWNDRLSNIKIVHNHVNGNCPICDDTKRHFYANIFTGAWDCKKCQSAGNTITYLKDHEELDNQEIAECLKGYGINGQSNPTPERKPTIFEKERINYYCSQLTEDKLKEFARERGLKVETLKQYETGVDKFGNFTLPVYDHKGAIRNILRKRPNGSTISSKDGESFLFGVEDLKGEDSQIFVVEGAWSALALKERGYKAVGTIGAGILKDEQVDLFKGKEVVFIPDLDPAGFQGVTKIIKKIKGAAQSIATLDLAGKVKEKQDIRDYFKNGGTKEEFDLLITKAVKHETDFQSLIEKFGEPYYLTKDGGLTSINQSFWAGLHNKENIQLFESDEKMFYRYSAKTGIYTDITEHAIKTEISECMLTVSREKNISGLEAKRTTTTLNHIVAHLKGIGEKRHAFQKKSNYVHLANRILTFDDEGKTSIKLFSPDLYSRNYCPIVFDETARCDRFLNELLLPAVTKDDALIIQKYTGLCLLGNNLIQRILILEGLSARGKSTLALIIQKLIGQINVTQLRTQHLDKQFELYRYLKKTLLVGVDVPGNFLSHKSANVIKGLVGGDELDAEKKGGNDNFKMRGNFCILITANSRLQVKLYGDSDIGAWKRRLLIVRFDAPPPKNKIPDFADILIKEEGPGMLNWGLNGLSSLLKDIEQYGNIYMPPAQENIIDALLAESDSLRHFLKEALVRDENMDISVSEIVEAYAEFCPSKGWNPKPITIIYKELESLMLELFGTSKSNSIKREGKSSRGFRRVKLKNNKHELW